MGTATLGGQGVIDFDADWMPLPTGDIDRVAEAIQAIAADVPDVDLSLVQRYGARFYFMTPEFLPDAWLVRARLRFGDPRFARYFLISDRVQLFGAPGHDWENRIRPGLIQVTSQTVFDYLGFFCRFSAGIKGRLRIIERIRDLPLGVPMPRELSKRLRKDFHRPMVHTANANGIRLAAWGLFGNRLVRLRFEVSPIGTVAIENGEIVSDVLQLKGGRVIGL